ncbi:ETEC_3214 domain-containing protein [Streptomyces sp900116325]|uniref:ETEC_3214 domain-containing protein n=1 Tax=Streptomyces sp. 900116325 TaxID=3154295 RepID=UPI0033D8174D
MSHDPEPWYTTTLNVWTLAGTLVAAMALAKAVSQGWKITLGRRRHLIARLRNVAPGVRHEYVKELFGEPTWALERGAEGLDGETRSVTVRTWPLHRMGYLVTWCTDDESVAMYAITTTSRWFRPRIIVGDIQVRLGLDRITVMDSTGEPRGRWSELGARRFSYWEQYHFGNPGGYRYWYVGVNDLGYDAHAPVNLEQMTPEELAVYRPQATINTVAVSGVSGVREELLLTTNFGPDMDLVRLALPDYQIIDGLRRRVQTRFDGSRPLEWCIDGHSVIQFEAMR